MGRLRINYFDVVGRALGGQLDDRRVGAAIERLSGTYREGRSDLDFRSPQGRAAYLWHLLPAHVCDQARLLEDLPELVAGRRELRVAAVGAGPGTEALALLEVISAAKERGELQHLESVRVARLDSCSHWDEAFTRVLPVAMAFAAEREAAAGGTWTLDAPAETLHWDLRDGMPDGGPVRDELSRADLVTFANVLSEVAPRGTSTLPAPLAATVARLCAEVLRPGASLLMLDRLGAPGVRGRIEHFAELGRTAGLQVVDTRERETRCACVLTREAKRIYRHVHLPTTRAEDRPVRNCKTAWCLLQRPRAQATDP